MNKLLSYLVALWALVVPLTGLAQQVCQSESAIPSSTPTSRFSDHGNGTVSDGGTGLMWARCAAGLSGANCETGKALTFTWGGALNHAAESAHAGYSDWRLPTVSELVSILEQRCSSPAINASVFPNTPVAVDFLSSSPSAHPWLGQFNQTWLVRFSDGSVLSWFRYSVPLQYVRLVRAGQ